MPYAQHAAAVAMILTDLIDGATVETLDLRGKQHFPNDDRGFVFIVRTDRMVTAPYSGRLERERRTYAVRHRDDGITNGWQVDLNGGLATAVLWETGVRGTWDTAAEAAMALVGHLTAATVRADIASEERTLLDTLAGR
jgi:hypothetical protein